MSDTARSNRFHIGVFGRRNTGKSSLVNAIAKQQVSIVSDVAGTTTDVVWKNIELPGVGAAIIADTAGYDDEGVLGGMRVKRTMQVAQRIDLALIIVSGNPHDATFEIEWIEMFRKATIPSLILFGRCDESDSETIELWRQKLTRNILPVSAKNMTGINVLLKQIADIYKKDDNFEDITEGLVEKGDTVVLVMPQDAQAPKGRLIQPQVITLRNLLDKHCLALCCAPEELEQMLGNLSSPPSFIITDSQVFAQVKALTPPQTKLTSFSVLMARYKGDIEVFRAAADVLVNLPSNARILIAEACSHIPQNEDIGRVKLPRMLRKRLGEDITIDVVGGNDFPDDLTPYDIIIHCGACMFTRRHVMSRIRRANAQHIPITNYGIAIAALTGILDRVVY